MADGWYPQFVDYLALSFNTAMAFSPTDVSAIKPWAKLLMIVRVRCLARRWRRSSWPGPSTSSSAKTVPLNQARFSSRDLDSEL